MRLIIIFYIISMLAMTAIFAAPKTKFEQEVESTIGFLGPRFNFYDDDKSNYITLEAPTIVGSNRTITFPDITGILLTENSTATLTGKTIVVADNTITTAAIGNLGSIELNNALAELQGDIDTTNTNLGTVSGDLSTHISDTTNPHSVTATQVGLGNVDDTSDMDKPVSTDQQAAIDAVQGSIDDHVDETTGAHAAVAISNTTSGNLTSTNVQSSLEELQGDIDGVRTDLGDTTLDLSNHLSDFANPHSVTATQVGLDQVDNTSDLDKPISTDQQAAIDAVQGDIDDHIADTSDAHDASAISNVASGNLTSTDVQGSLDELQGELDGANTDIGNLVISVGGIATDLTNHMGSTTQHGATGAVVGTTNSQTLTNKTLTAPIIDVASLTEQASTPTTPSSGTKKLYAKTNGRTYTLDSSGNEVRIGKSDGEINYILNPNADDTISGWVDYADSAAARPVDGIGGSPVTQIARDLTSKLIGTTSFLIGKSNANRQGEGSSYNFSIDAAMISPVVKPQEITSYYTSTGNFTYGSLDGITPSDISVFVYDVTNATLITPFPNTLDGSGIYKGVFYPSPTSTSYRLIYHIGTTNALSYSFYAGNVKVAPLVNSAVKAETDWISWTPATAQQGFGNISASTAKYRIDGPDVLVEAQFTTGTHSGSDARFELPPGMISASNYPSGQNQIVGTYTYNGAAYGFTVLMQPGVTYFTFGSGISGNGYTVRTGSNITGSTSNGFFTLQARVRVQGYTSGNPTLGSMYQNLPVEFEAFKNGGSITTNTNIPSWTTVVKDTTGSFNATTGVYTVYSGGDYSGVLQLNLTGSTNGTFYIVVNGTQTTRKLYLNTTVSTRGHIPFQLKNLVPGNTISIQRDSNGTIASSNDTNWTMSKDNSPSSLFTINRSTTKYLGANLTSATNPIPALTFNNLIVGKKYRAYLNVSSSMSASAVLFAVHNGSDIGAANTAIGSSISFSSRISRQVEFTASATTLTFRSTHSSGTLLGDGTALATYVILEELNNTVEGGF